MATKPSPSLPDLIWVNHNPTPAPKISWQIRSHISRVVILQKKRKQQAQLRQDRTRTVALFHWREKPALQSGQVIQELENQPTTPCYVCANSNTTYDAGSPTNRIACRSFNSGGIDTSCRVCGTTRNPSANAGAIKNRVSISIRPNLLLEAGYVDPFGTLAADAGYRTSDYMEFYTHVTGIHTYPTNIKDVDQSQDLTRACWMRLAISNRVLLHALVGHFAVWQAQLQGVPMALLGFPLPDRRGLPQIVLDSFHHRLETIRLIKDMLLDPEAAFNDALVAAVAIIAGTEHLDTSTRAPRHHFEGLSKMIKLRGGISTLPSYIVDQVFINDSRNAQLYLTKPQFTETYEIRWDISPPPLDPALHPRLFLLGTQLLDPEIAAYLDQRLFGLCKDLRDLTIVTNAHKDDLSSLSVSQMKYFERRACRLEHDLLSLPHEAIPISPFQDACRLAGLIYAQTGLWVDESVPDNFIPELVDQLATLLQNPNPDSFPWRYKSGRDSIYMEVLLWICFIAAHGASIGGTHRRWFVQLFGLTARTLELQSWEEVEHILTTFLYLQDQYRQYLQVMWKESKE